MGLLQKAVETYDAMQGLVGEYIDGKEPLAPIGHLIAQASIQIEIDADGNFKHSSPVEKTKEDKNANKVIIPVTELSAGRTGTLPHPLCDQLKYIADYPRAKADKEDPFDLYVNQLTEWSESEYSSPKLHAILKYVLGRTVLSDLKNDGNLELNDNGSPKDEKLLVRWVVHGIEDGQKDEVWKDKDILEKYSKFYLSRNVESDGQTELDLISGEETGAAKQHLKGVVSLYGNAKIISSNDSQNFTYRGRFNSPEQAASIGYVSSQKAHNALKWVVSNQGVIIGGRVFVCWNPKGADIDDPMDELMGFNEEKAATPTEYRKLLEETLLKRRSKLPDGEDVVIASFEAATTGRLAISYYNELKASDFHNRIDYWDNTCCWYTWDSKEKKQIVNSPQLRDIVKCAFGYEQGQFIDADPKIMGQHVQRLLACRVDMAPMPQDIMAALVEKAGTPLAYSSGNRQHLLSVACAVIQKYRKDIYKEDINMALEPEKNDRSYQYGRLLAVMEKAERDTYDADEGREPNAIRMWSVYTRRPQYAEKIITEQLKKSYLPRLTPLRRRNYDILSGQIHEQLSNFPDSELNKPLKETYLLGYYLQKNELYKSHKNDGTTADSNENNENTDAE